jgi:hypothetical protein
MRKFQNSVFHLQGPKSGRPPGRYRGCFLFPVFGNFLALGAGCLVLLPAFAVQAQSITNPVSSRYLLVINTARTMEPRAAGVQKAITDLLGSGMGGQLRSGDTLGVWTFNEDLYTGRFPLQKWSPDTKAEITLNLVSFLKNQKYEKKAVLDKVLPALEKIIQASPFITVVLVSDGDEKMRGTPFDAQINKYYGLWRDQQRKAQMPLLTVLRASNGAITHYAMNTAPWPVDMPPLAPEIKALADAEKNSSKAPRTSVPPLILSGKKLREERGEKANTNIAATPGATSISAAPTSNPDAKQSIITGGSTNPANQEAIHELPASAATVTGASATSVEPVVTNTDTSHSESAELAKTDPIVSPEKADTAERPTQTDAQRTTSSSSSELASTNSNPAAVAALAPPNRNLKLVMLGGVILIAAAGAGAVLLLRRARATPQISLITRSLEREKKP